MTMYHIKSFIEKGKYCEMKHLEFVMSSIKENIRAFQETTEEMRIEWKEIGVVSKFVSNKEYNWDMHALKVLFFDLGILISACSINNEKLSEEQLATLIQDQKRGETYVRFSPNKQLLKVKSEDNTCFADMAPQQQLLIWKGLCKKHEKLLTEWDRIRKIAKSSSILHKEKRVAFDFGTISLLENKPRYLAADVYNTFGVDALLAAAVIDISKIEELASRGFLSISSVNKYRTTVDVKLKFFLMVMEKEKAMLDFKSQRLRMLSNLSINNTNSN